MAVSEMSPETETPAAVPSGATGPGEVERLLGSGDHTIVGLLFIGFSLLYLVVALLARVVVGLDLLFDNGILGDHRVLAEMSSLVALVALGVVPLLVGIGLHVVPLQLGSPAIAFPRAAALSFWSWLVFSVIFVTSVAVDGGIGGADGNAARLGNVAFAALLVSLSLAAVCIATTVMTHRPAGMHLARVPLFSWSMLVASTIWILSFGSAVAHSVLAHLTKGDAASYLDNFNAGLSWLVRGPAVYMLAIPALGIAGDAMAVATGRRLRPYGAYQALIGAFGILSFGAWATLTRSVHTALWAIVAVLVMVPVLGMLGGLLDTMRHGRVRLDAFTVGSLLALVNLVGAGLVGLLMALDTAGTGNLFDVSPLKLGTAQTIFVITGALVGALAGLDLWGSKVWGAQADDRTATMGIGLVDIGGLLLALALVAQVFDASDVLVGIVAALGALGMLLGVVVALVAVMQAAGQGVKLPDDPADGLTLEWQTPSPAMGAVRDVEVPAVGSPYPLLDLKEGE